MSIDWQHLRSFNGSQNKAFEEICCQLAASESFFKNSEFIRKGTPDAGIECFWKLPNGDEYGWQAKFFLSPPDDKQWHQIDNSVKVALEKHNRLISYTICLPIDRSDSRINEQKSFMDKWNERRKKWEEWSIQKNMSVTFNYWGEHEIWERLSREEHRGRYLFWFDKELFSQSWFEKRLEEAIAICGPRYTPELNVKIPMASLFHGLGRTSEFYYQIREMWGKIKSNQSNVFSQKVEKAFVDQLKPFKTNLNNMLSLLDGLNPSSMEPIGLDDIANIVRDSLKFAREFYSLLRNSEEEKKKEPTSSMDNDQYLNDQSKKFDSEHHYLRKLEEHLFELEDFIASSQAKLANKPALLIVGNAGTGKTHLFCDVAKQRIDAGLPTILLLGGHFNSNEPWSQILQYLQMSCTKEEFLDSLQAAAQAKSSRALILIDALNEGEGKRLWENHISGILTTLSRYPWIGIAVTVRSSYENCVIPGELVPGKLIREEHDGFANNEYQAARTFFNYYGIVHPGVPLMIPEFQNPLFLKLFCQGLKNKNLTRIPPGLKGITAIFEFFVDSVNEKLAKPGCLDFDEKSKLVHQAVDKLAGMMGSRSSKWLAREEAKEEVNSLLPYNGYVNSLFSHMISEGIIAEDRHPDQSNEWCDAIQFSYERLSDHLIAKYLLDKHIDNENPDSSFLTGQPFSAFIKDESDCWMNRGIIEAFSIQLPERIKKELVELIPDRAHFLTLREAFVESLLWRHPEAFTESTKKYINEQVIRYKDTHDQFIEVLLTVSSNPAHPYNADFLHKSLVKQELAERDAWWSIYIHNQYGEHGAVDRLVDWAWSEEEKSHIDDNSMRLFGMTLAWFLTTSHRFLRDRSTKALVSLLTNRIHVLREIICSFLNVNDLYILERLFAVAYGCAMRSTDNDAIGSLAKDVYDWIFKNEEPIPHILLRDYARGVVELALDNGIPLDINVAKIRPPYKSAWPSLSIPEKDELKKDYDWRKGMSDEEVAYVDIYDSVMDFGDFARYIIGTNHNHFKWSSCPINKKRKLSKKDRYEKFVQSLNTEQRIAFNLFKSLKPQVLILPSFIKQSIGLDNHKNEENPKEKIFKDKLEKSEKILRIILGKKKLKQFESFVLPYLNEPVSDEDVYQFDLSIVQGWIFKRVLDLGWTAKRFGQFDRNLYYNGRGAKKAERIGKKYQWIAYHECLARISDNFEFIGDSYPERSDKYEGPWQLNIRDIDPSCLLKKTEDEEWGHHTKTWWSPTTYDFRKYEDDDINWMKSEAEFPDFKSLIEIEKPSDGSRWLLLEGAYRSIQPLPPGMGISEMSRRDIWYMLRSYIVKKSNINKIFTWAKKQNFMGRWMPESRVQFDNVFLGEFFWAPAYRYQDNPASGYDEWIREVNDKQIPGEVLVSTEEYVREDENFDCSIDHTIQIYAPAKWLVNQMKLQWNGIEGEFHDDRGNLIVFDPSVREKGPGALLINRNIFIKFLNDNGYDILWTILGKKRIIGGNMSRKENKGHLEINGVYRIHGEKICGEFKTNFVEPVK